MRFKGKAMPKVARDLLDERMIENMRLEVEERKETKGGKILSLLQKNNELKALLRNLDSERREFSDANKRLEGEKSTLEKKLLMLGEEEKRFREEVKGVQFSKGTTSKVFEGRIEGLKKELKALEHGNEELRKAIEGKRAKHGQVMNQQRLMYEKFGDEDDWDNAIALRAKPRLFGDCE